jgi:hypothetical protein
VATFHDTDFSTYGAKILLQLHVLDNTECSPSRDALKNGANLDLNLIRNNFSDMGLIFSPLELNKYPTSQRNHTEGRHSTPRSISFRANVLCIE